MMFKYTLRDKKNRKLICFFFLHSYSFAGELHRILIIYLIDFDDIHKFVFLSLKHLTENIIFIIKEEKNLSK